MLTTWFLIVMISIPGTADTELLKIAYSSPQDCVDDATIQILKLGIESWKYPAGTTVKEFCKLAQEGPWPVYWPIVEYHPPTPPFQSYFPAQTSR